MLVFSFILSVPILTWILRTTTGERLIIRLFDGRKAYYDTCQDNLYEAFYDYRFEKKGRLLWLILPVGILVPVGAIYSWGINAGDVVLGISYGFLLALFIRVDSLESETKREKM